MTHGRVQAVHEDIEGTWLAVDAAIGATTLTVYDLGVFDDAGGTVELRDATNTEQDIVYTGLDYDNVRLTGVTGVSNAYLTDEASARPWPYSPVRYAEVVIEGEDEAVAARIPHVLLDHVPLGFRDRSDAESVDVILDSEEWVVSDILGESPVVDASFVDPITMPPANITDSLPPGSSPTPTVQGGVGFLAVKWTPIANHDAVTYEVHIGTAPAFTIVTATTKAGEISGTMFFIRTLPDGTALDYSQPYYVKLIAKDTDGAAAVGGETGPAFMVAANTPDIATDAITANQILAGTITAAELSVIELQAGQSITVGSPTGSHVTIDGDDGVTMTAPDGVSPLVQLPLDGTPATFKGGVKALSLTVDGNATFNGTSNEFSSSSITQLKGAIGNPISAPTISQTFPTKVRLNEGAGASGLHRQLFYDAAGGAGGATPVFYAALQAGTGYYHYIGEYDAATGARLRYFDMTSVFSEGNIYGVVTIGLYLYALVILNSGPCHLVKIEKSSFAFNSNSYLGTGAFFNAHPSLTTNGTYIFTIDNDVLNGRIRLRAYDTSFARQSGQDVLLDTAVQLPSNTSWFGGAVLATEDGTGGKPTINGGAPTWWLSLYGSNVGFGVFGFTASTGAYLGSNYFWGSWTDNAYTDGLAYDGTNFWTYRTNSDLAKMSNWFWTTESPVYWGAYTWYDSAGTPHESLASPRSSITLRRRAYSTATVPAIPGPPTPGADDPDGFRFYLERGGTDPDITTYGNMKLQATVGSRGTSLSTPLSTFVVAGVGGVSDPTTNGFAALAANPAILKDDTGAWALYGDGRSEGLPPAGSVLMWAGSAAPTGYLLCNGDTTLLRTAHPLLFAAIGVAWGAVDGTHFTLPDLRGYLPIGVGGTPALALAAASGSWSHQHSFSDPTSSSPAGGAGLTAGGVTVAGAGHTHSVSGTTGTSNPPVKALNYIIKDG